MSRPLSCALYILLATTTVPTTLLAVDGPALTGPGEEVMTYFEVVGAEDCKLQSTASLPTSVYVSESEASLTYASSENEDGNLSWRASFRNFERNHERVDGVYHLLLLLPLPDVGVTNASHAIGLREGSEESSVPLIYGGEKVLLKRNRALEAALVPGITGGLPDQLPSLAGTGYRYTIWDTILGFDPDFGGTVQGFADFLFSTGPGVAAPDPDDARQAAYVLVWIPGLDPSIPPFAIRVDVTDGVE